MQLPRPGIARRPRDLEIYLGELSKEINAIKDLPAIKNYMDMAAAVAQDPYEVEPEPAEEPEPVELTEASIRPDNTSLGKKWAEEKYQANKKAASKTKGAKK